MAAITHDLRVDWSNNGSFTDAEENVTGRVCARPGVTVQFGRDQYRALSPVAAGEMRFELDNASREYSPENSGSPIGANLKPGRPVRHQITHDAITYGVFRGHLDDFNINPDTNVKRAWFTCLDGLAKLVKPKVSTPLHEGIRTGAAIGHVLDAAGWPSGSRDLDIGATIIRHWWEDGTAAYEALQKVLASEGSPAVAYVDPATGNFMFRDRHHRLTRAASTTSQATWRGSGAEPVMSPPFVYEHGYRDIVNDIAFEVDERNADGVLTNVWETDDVITVAASSSVIRHVQASDPFKGAVAPVADTDFTVLSGSVSSVTLSRTSGQSTIITVNAGASGATIGGLRLRAFSAPVVRTYKITASDAASIADHGSAALPSGLEPVWAGRHDAQALADLYVLQRAQRVPIVRTRMTGGNDTRIVQCLTRKISDRVTLVETESGLNDDFFVERIELGTDGVELTVDFGLEKVPTQPAVFILGTSVLNTGVLGY
jgi:hypothetical protein